MVWQRLEGRCKEVKLPTRVAAHLAHRALPLPIVCGLAHVRHSLAVLDRAGQEAGTQRSHS